MPALTEHLGLPPNFPTDTCLYVQQDYWGYSSLEPLATTGAGPCMNVVVHRDNVGCLAHIWNNSVSQTEIYHHACFSIKDMIETAIGHNDNLNIWLGAGRAFRLGSNLVMHDLAIYDFGTYLAGFLGQMNCPGVTITDRRLHVPLKMGFDTPTYDPGCIVYQPTTGCVYLLHTNRLDNEGFLDQIQVHGVQTGNHPQTYQQCF